MSGYTGDDLSRRIGQASNVMVLEKPFNASGLLRAVRDSLDGSERLLMHPSGRQ